MQGIKNKEADGLSRAYDTGLVKCDDQISNRHPALENLGATPIEGDALKLEEYLDKCDGYIQHDWPKLLEQYKIENCDNVNLENVNTKIENEIGYVHRLAEAKTNLHSDKVTIKQERNRKIQDQADNLENETEIEQNLETTDSKFKVAYYNVSLIAINNSCFSYPSFLALQNDDEFCHSKTELVERNDIRTINQGFLGKRGLLMKKSTTADGQVYYTVCILRALVPSLLSSTHENLLIGHLGKEKYLLTLRR